jgi:membrane-bound ClpP family serine protease
VPLGTFASRFRVTPLLDFPFGHSYTPIHHYHGDPLLIYFKLFQAMRREPQTGQEAMLGKKGVVIEDIDPEGKIQYAGEIWDAKTTRKRFLKGELVRIASIRGLMLLVEEMPNRE